MSDKKTPKNLTTPCVAIRGQARQDPSISVPADCLLDQPAGNQAAQDALPSRRPLPSNILEIVPDGDPIASLDQLWTDLEYSGDNPGEEGGGFMGVVTPNVPCGGGESLSGHPQLLGALGNLMSPAHWKTSNTWDSTWLDDGTNDLANLGICDYDVRLTIRAFVEGADVGQADQGVVHTAPGMFNTTSNYSDASSRTQGTTLGGTLGATAAGTASNETGNSLARGSSLGVSATSTDSITDSTVYGSGGGLGMTLPAQATRGRLIWLVKLEFSEVLFGTSSKEIELDVGTVLIGGAQ